MKEKEIEKRCRVSKGERKETETVTLDQSTTDSCFSPASISVSQRRKASIVGTLRALRTGPLALDAHSRWGEGKYRRPREG